MDNFGKSNSMSSKNSSQPVTPFKNFHLEVFESDEDEAEDVQSHSHALESCVPQYSMPIISSETNSISNSSSRTNSPKKTDQRLKLKRKNKSGGSIKGRSRKIRKTNNKMSVKSDLFNHFNEILEKELNTIDTKASDSKLTVANVKDILKTVITNEHVVAMVRQQANDGCDKSSESEEPYSFGLPGLKLTRSKTKELLATKPEMAWPLTPAKRPPEPTECQFLIEQDLPEDSSDEEYQPNEEEIEDDREETASDWDLGSQPPTPCDASTPRPPSNLDCSTQTSWTEDGTFRVPAENIGQRTRSKLSLSDTALETIEKAFVPPDITTDMYDFVCEDDDWRDFLNKFTEPMKPSANETMDDDDEADPEYNLLADEDKEDVDQEELRMDRGVKVSKRELNQLMTELFDMYDSDIPSTSRTFTSIPAPDSTLFDPGFEEEDEEESQFVQTCSDNAPEEVGEPLQISSEQIELLRQHMRKHVQLTAQHFVQTYGHPILSQHSAQCKEQLVTLKCLSEGKTNSVFDCENLDSALKLVKDWESLIDSDSRKAAEHKEFMIREINSARSCRKVRRKYVCHFSTLTFEMINESKAVIFPLLLPEIPFRCDGFHRTAVFPSEEQLLAIGLEQFVPFVKGLKSHFKSKFDYIDAVTLIHQHLLPAHEPESLMWLIKKKKATLPGPIKHYFEYKLAPGTDHFVIKFSRKQLKTLKQQPPELLPDAWREHFFPGLFTSHNIR